jgi:hypothetical protein
VMGVAERTIRVGLDEDEVYARYICARSPGGDIGRVHLRSHLCRGDLTLGLCLLGRLGFGCGLVGLDLAPRR